MLCFLQNSGRWAAGIFHGNFRARLFLSLAAAALLVSGCLASYGTYRLSLKASSIFETYQVLEGYQYYYSGSDSRPKAILAISPKYTLETQLWKPVAPDSEMLKSWLFMMSLGSYHNPGLKGALLLRPNGEEIGYFYSYYKPVYVQMLEDGRVEIPTPNHTGKMRTPRLFGYRDD